MVATTVASCCEQFVCVHEHTGVKEADWIFHVNGLVTDDNDDFQRLLQSFKPGTVLELDVRDNGPNGAQSTVKVELGGIGVTNKRPDHIEWIRTIRAHCGAD